MSICTYTGLKSNTPREIDAKFREIHKYLCHFNLKKVVGIAEYNDNTAATNAGLVIGDLYRTGDTVKIVHA